jgi:uncharacterized membrane protein
MDARQGIFTGAGGSTRLERLGLWVLGAFTAASVLGFASFGLNPGMLVHLPAWAAAFYGAAFRFFAVGQVWLAMAVFALLLVGRTGLRWLPSFGALYLISLSAELLGTTRGIPFGEYSYSGLLDPMWAGHVPVVIPLSWFYMAVPSYALGMLALPGAERSVARVGLASLVLLIWDLALDPAMSFATPYWAWEATGPYYGMPWLNLFGWYVTGLALMAALHALRADRWIRGLPLGWLAGFYLLNLLLPLGMNLAAGLWLAVAVTLGGVGGVLLLIWRLAARTAAVEVTRSTRAVFGAPGSAR